MEQRFQYGDPATRYTFVRKSPSLPARNQLSIFFDSVQGTTSPFYYDAPNDDGTTTMKLVYLDNAPLTLEQLSNEICSTGMTFVKIQTTAPTYSVNATVTRFPSSALATALQGQTQEIIPLVKIRVLDATVPDIYLSDRRVTIGSHDYLPHLLRMNEPGSDTIITQSIDGSSIDPISRMGVTTPMNQRSTGLILAGLMVLFSAGLLCSHNQQTVDTFSKLAFATLTGLTAYLQVHKD